MSEFDFGDEHLKFLFERWKVDAGIAEAGKQAKINIQSADEGFMHVQQLEARMKKYIGNLERWMEGKASTVGPEIEDDDE